MKRIFIFPTIEEAKAFILTQPRDPVFVAGVGAAEIAATTTAISAGGAPEPLRPAPSRTDMTSASAPISTTPTTITAMENAVGSFSSGALLGRPSFRSARG